MNLANLFDMETWRLKFRGKILIPVASRFLSKRLPVTDFTIISNNCWGGTVYETYGLPKQSPTVGMFIMPDDYIKLVADLQRYLNTPLIFIRPEESKWASELSEKPDWGSYLIGQIGDVELHMLHYHSKDIAQRKWNSRIKRINYDRLIFKFNDQNGATRDHLKSFDALPLNNKILFSVHDLPTFKSAVKINAPRSHKFVRASYEPLIGNRSWNLSKYITSCFIETAP